MGDYSDFIKRKQKYSDIDGLDISYDNLNQELFDWQKQLVRLALKKKRYALFEDCGLGKTFQQLEWAHQIHKATKANILILAPLAVSSQTKAEGEIFHIDVNICKTGGDIKPGINITNYERLHHFKADDFTAIVLDESSIIKNFAGEIKKQIIEMFKFTPYKLCCTATPSPNDYIELGNTAEFLGVMTRPEMLASYFINDSAKTGKWRLKGHVEDNIFWQWLSSWATMIRKPSDIGFDDNGFILPELKIKKHILDSGNKDLTLFPMAATTLTDRLEARRSSLDIRCQRAASLVNDSDETWLIWCDYNDESSLLKKLIGGGVEVRGQDTPDHKEKSIIEFAHDNIKCLITKPTIAGFGINWQNCHNVIFVGLSDSYEKYYQATRRCWRFGQKHPVNIHIILSEQEIAVLNNIQRKEAEMTQMYSNLLEHMGNALNDDIFTNKLNAEQTIKLPEFLNESA
jgi:SNF2 family DNA or RNA helicase